MLYVQTSSPVLHLPHQRYPPPVLARPPHSGLLDVFRSARPSRFGLQNITLAAEVFWPAVLGGLMIPNMPFWQ